MKPVDVKDNTYIGFKKEDNDKNPKFKVGDHVRISKYKNIFAKGKKFYENELQKTNQKEFRIEKVLKKKGDNLYVKWKGYDNSFNSWIDKKDIVYISVNIIQSLMNHLVEILMLQLIYLIMQQKMILKTLPM